MAEAVRGTLVFTMSCSTFFSLSLVLGLIGDIAPAASLDGGSIMESTTVWGERGLGQALFYFPENIYPFAALL